MGDKQKNKKTTAANEVDVVVSLQTMPVIPTSISSTIDSFTKLKEVAFIVERHYDRYTNAEEKASLQKVLNKLTELNVSNLTLQLNDVEKAQAAMLIRQIIKDHILLERVQLQDNNFAPPDLQFIVKALIYVFYEPGKKYQLNKVNLNNSVTAANLERSSAEIMQLRKAYGNNISLDAPVYDHFIENYRKVTNHYLHYLAKKIILPKANQVASGTEAEILQVADAVIRQGLPDGTKNKVRFELAVKKFQAVRQLTDILQSNLSADEMFEKFQLQYKASKKILSKTINKDDDTHLERFYEQIGDVKPQSFIPVKRDSHSIFKEPKKKKRAKKSKKRASTKKTAQPA
ncbi:MAG: hypothetical protein V4501_06655 [Pseudomonadota bacterium]